MEEIQFYLTQMPVASFIFLATIGISIFAMGREELLHELALNPYSFLRHKKYYQPLSSGFIHADFLHLGFNMVSYYFFAFGLEYTFVSHNGGAGHFYFFMLYIITMLLADVQTIYKHRNNPGYTSLGASGAVAGVIFSMMLFEPKMKIFMFGLPFGIPAPLYGLLYIAVSVYAVRQNRDNINHEAHLGGAFAGMIITTIFYPHIWVEFFDTLL